MAHKHLVLALVMILPSVPVSAASAQPEPMVLAPAGTAETRYCLRVGPVTGRIAETIECWTREQWAEQDVDVDQEWAEEGVGIKA
jgi:hypothetical protein